MNVPHVLVGEIPDLAVMVDVREQDEWDAGHAPGAIHVPLGQLPMRLGDLPDADGTPLPIICRSGNRSGYAVAWLVSQGFDVANVAGGMRAWHRAGKEMVPQGGSARVI